MSKYDHLIHTFEKQETLIGGNAMPRYQMYFRGHDCLPDSNFYSPYRCYMKESFVDRWPTFHTEEELLCWVGYDMVDPWGSFDAEIEFWIGNERTQMVQYIITEPTIVRIPPYTWHCPLEYRRVGKPVYFQLLIPNGKFGTFSQKIGEDGKKSMIYSAFTLDRPCKLDATKKCTFCGKCYKADINEPKSAAETMALIRAGA